MAVARIIGFLQSHIASVEYFRAENEGTVRVAPSPVNQFIPATSPFFPAGAPVTGCLDSVPVRSPTGEKCPLASAPVATTRPPSAFVRFVRRGRGWDYRFGVGRSESESISSVSNGYLSDTIVQDGIIAGSVNPFGPQNAAGQLCSMPHR